MKLKILAVLVAAFAMFAVSMAQGHETGTKNARVSATKSKQLYACPKCEMASMTGGKCPGCHADMVKIEGKKVYMCPKCHMVGKKGETCSHCNAKMVAGVETYACDKCHTSSKKAGKCSMCGMAMKKQDLPKMGKG